MNQAGVRVESAPQPRLCPWPAPPSLAAPKCPVIRPYPLVVVVSLAFHPGHSLAPLDYSIPLTFPRFCPFYSVIGSFAVYGRDEQQKVLTTQASKIMCQAQKKKKGDEKKIWILFLCILISESLELISFPRLGRSLCLQKLETYF